MLQLITKRLLPYFLIAVFCLINLIGIAQQKETKVDSVNKEVLQNFNKKLERIESLRKQDSIRKQKLEIELQSLKTVENLKKDELMDQLARLNNKEEQRLAKKRAEIDSLRAHAKGFPVIGFFNDTLFLVYSRSGSLSALDRATIISQRLQNQSNIAMFIDSVKVIPSDGTTDIIFEDKILMSVTENDALWNDMSKDELAQKYKTIIVEEMNRYKSETTFARLLKEVGLALLIIFGLYWAIYFLNKIFRFTKRKIIAYKNVKYKGIAINNYTLFNASQELKLFLTINKILKWLLIVVLIYISLPLIFSIFPWTKGFAQLMVGYILNPIKNIARQIWNYIPNLFTIIVVVAFFRYLIKGFRYLKKEVETEALRIPGFYPDWANPTFQIIKVLLYAFMFVVIFPYLPGSNSPVFQGVSVFLGVLFTFGSSGSLSNIIAGLILTYMRAFRLGDRVKIGDNVGDIVEKTLLVTRLRTIKNEIISIPNSNVMNSHTINYSIISQEDGLIMHTTITIGYDVPWKVVHQALLTAASRTQGLENEPKPFVLQTSLDDFYVAYEINAFTHLPNKQGAIYSELHQHIQDSCNELGIEIMSPHYRANRDGNMSTIPSDYLPKDYVAPAFNVDLKK